MKKSIFPTALLIGSLLISGCNTAQTDISETSNQIKTDNSEVVIESEDKTDDLSLSSDNQNSNTKEKSISNSNNQKSSDNKNKTTLIAGKEQPKIATIKEIVQGDLKCYVTLIDKQGKEQIIGADFEICPQKEQFLNKQVKLSYDILNFNDCQSNEPCGKTKKESAIVKMEVISDSKSAKSSGDTQTLSNGEWNIKLSNYDSWNGVNNTGNVKYYGCDSKGSCLELTGGKVSCRNGKCVTGWKNGSYSYVIEDLITEDGNNPQGSTLIVRQAGKVIVRAEGLKSV